MSVKKAWSLIVLGVSAFFGIRRFYRAWKGPEEGTMKTSTDVHPGYAPGWNAR